MTAETMKVFGVKADGSTDLLGEAPITPSMKMHEIVRSYYGVDGSSDSHEMEAQYMLGALEQFSEWSEAVSDNARFVSTDEAAEILGIKSDTLRFWSCHGGPVQPADKSGGRLGWRVIDLKRYKQIRGEKP